MSMLAGVGTYLGGEHADQRWRASLRRARCEILSARTKGDIAVRTQRDPTELGGGIQKGEYVENTTVELQVSVSPTRRIQQVLKYRLGPAKGAVDCWVPEHDDQDVVLDPERELVERLKRTVQWSALLFLAGFAWGATWFIPRRRRS